MKSLVDELQLLVETEGLGVINRKRFLRMCKRHGVSYHTATEMLIWSGILLPKTDKQWHPCLINLKPREWHTYHGWKHKGWQVMRGERSSHIVGKNGFKRPMFSNLQVKWIPYED
ncbi:hypothetical protein KNV09_gp128 [Vibrio phage Athena]|uniref:Uncharacterized protein n=6 Tax=Thalassavirus TaxID=2948922 RepID=A0A6M9Z2G0_9CAUD|nr:hypothetical protein KNU52_gp110 [Vibrio phage Achelous]YP_010105944.1 hypothetical protein KNU88_gp128 [Vibrio phage Chester]YP_010108395.1 hypothetical protein KNV07_gp127 [Vibrio phage Cody]YP_010108589.1 hypothetical protein KNV08_gp131 [Vibrio phage Quinn]YP_010108782.1 hypothetical protein KNV09_gp128 [Vibrio phage Athena]QIG66279.1 hypothetical protein CILSICK_180 [Vibrio phage Cilsick]QQO89996.1 hypothetical protein ABURR_186 [Vibrio phage ABurr]WCD55852.1 hypothetical protein ROC